MGAEPYCAWYADDDAIRQVDTNTNVLAISIPLEDPHRLVMDASDCGVWALHRANRTLLHFDAQGLLLQEIGLRGHDPRLDDADELALDPYDGSLWIADGHRLAHLSAQGVLLAVAHAPQRIRRLAFAHDLGVWALGHRELWRYDAKGRLLGSTALPAHLGEPKHIHIDPFAHRIWIAGERRVVQLDLDQPGQAKLDLRLADDVEAAALDTATGTLWLAHKDRLVALNRDGSVLREIDLAALGLRKPEKLAFDPVVRSLWLGAEKAVAQLTHEGRLVVKFKAKDGDEALGVPAARFSPTLALVRPGADVLTRNPTPVFGVAPGVACGDVPCALPEQTLQEHLAKFSFVGSLDGATLPKEAFAYDPIAREATYTPPQRLPEGTSRFAAQGTDPFGRNTPEVESIVTVDTVPPKFLSLSPASGSVLSAPNVSLEGEVDDAEASIVLDGVGNSGTRPKFAFPVMLAPGANSYSLTAIDKAGNATAASLTLNYVPPGIMLTVSNPVPGALVADDRVTVSGTFQGPPNTGITVNGVVAAVLGNRFVVPDLPLQPGMNTLRILATGGGLSGMQEVQVNSADAATLRLTASSREGTAPLVVQFDILGVPANAITTMDFRGDGGAVPVDPTRPQTYTYTQPGLYAAKLSATWGGETRSAMAAVVVADAAALDQELRQVWSEMTSALATRDMAKALSYFNETAQDKYRSVFDALQAQMPAIVNGFSVPQTVGVSTELGEYAINRTIDGENRIFFIYFVKDGNGVWRIDSM